jgi:hypothetical protein
MISTATLLAFTLRSCVTVTIAGNVRRTSVQLREPSISTVNVDDALVLRAVVEHTILPAVLRSNSGRNRSVLVLIEDRSSTLCQSQALESPYRIPAHWQQFLAPNAAGTALGMITDDQRRRELVASLEARIVRILDLSQLVPRPSVWYVPWAHFATMPSRSRSQAAR